MRNYRFICILFLLALAAAGCGSSKKLPLRLGVNFWASTE